MKQNGSKEQGKGVRGEISRFVVERLIGGEWIAWTAAPMTRDECDRFIFRMVEQAQPDESASDINKWRTVELTSDPVSQRTAQRNGLTGSFNLEDYRTGVAAAKFATDTPKPKPVKAPSIATMERWLNDGVARAVDGCRVEPDGTCPHGSPSWLIRLGVI